MNNGRHPCAYLIGTLFLIFTTALVSAQTETVLYSFGSEGDIADPAYGLAIDGKGNLYAVSQYGGVELGGGIAQLRPNSDGSWTETLIHSFHRGTDDGFLPLAEVVVDGNGNVFATTSKGGNGYCRGGCGTIVELKQDHVGGWGEKIIYNFKGGTGGWDGVSPAQLALDSDGNIYGITTLGGHQNYGTFYQLTHGANGSWGESTRFDLSGDSAAYPTGGLAKDSRGNLYGTTAWGGDYGYGTVFELSPHLGGKWSERVLYSFTDEGGGTFGPKPNGNLAMDGQGNLYGTTYTGGITSYQCPEGCGFVYKLARGSDGNWTKQVIYTFLGFMVDGANPRDGVILDPAGNLYGTTEWGGGGGGTTCSAGNNVLFCGTVFELSPQPDGSWKETILHSFTGGITDGVGPFGRLVFDTAGNLYGTTAAGGPWQGTIFRITPFLD